jgi:hypothetical protein
VAYKGQALVATVDDAREGIAFFDTQCNTPQAQDIHRFGRKCEQGNVMHWGSSEIEKGSARII